MNEQITLLYLLLHPPEANELKYISVQMICEVEPPST